MPFKCSICAEESTRICVRCTKDACDNHLCEKCLRCSDCCECEVTLSDSGRMPASAARAVVRAATAHPAAQAVPPSSYPMPEPPHPPPDPDPAPIPDDDEPGPEPFNP